MMIKKTVQKEKSIDKAKWDVVVQARDEYNEYWNQKGYGIGQAAMDRVEKYLEKNLSVTTEIKISTSIAQLDKIAKIAKK